MKYSGQDYSVGDYVEIYIEVYDSKGKLRDEGGDEFRAWVRSVTDEEFESLCI